MDILRQSQMMSNLNPLKKAMAGKEDQWDSLKS